MKKVILSIFTIGLIFALTGCVTSTIDSERVNITPKERVFSYQEVLPNEAIVRVARVNNFGAGGCYFSFLIDDQLASRIDVEEMAIFRLPEGKHKFQVTYDWNGRGLCGAFSEESSRRSGQIRQVILKKGHIYNFKIGYNSWGGVYRLFTDEGQPISSETNIFVY